MWEKESPLTYLMSSDRSLASSRRGNIFIMSLYLNETIFLLEPYQGQTVVLKQAQNNEIFTTALPSDLNGFPAVRGNSFHACFHFKCLNKTDILPKNSS